VTHSGGKAPRHLKAFCWKECDREERRGAAGVGRENRAAAPLSCQPVTQSLGRDFLEWSGLTRHNQSRPHSAATRRGRTGGFR
jgi:hypothetical protein